MEYNILGKKPDALRGDIESASSTWRRNNFDMNTADSIVARLQGLETASISVAELLQCGVVGALDICIISSKQT